MAQFTNQNDLNNVTQAITDAQAMVTVPVCRNALTREFGPEDALNDTRATGGAATLVNGQITYPEHPQNVFDGRHSNYRVNDDRNPGQRITVERYFQNNRGVEAIREGNIMWLSDRFFNLDRNGRARVMIHERNVHIANGRTDEEFDPQGRRDPVRGTQRINDIIRDNCHLLPRR